jgi:formylglycine-generating enzyme required for sulfatase activity
VADAGSGTPEGAAGDDGSTQCNTGNVDDAVDTGSRSACVSNYGAFDMVGNVDEWVADWVPQSTTCGSWSGSSDYQCLAGAATTGEPGALFRGGDFFSGAGAGPFTVYGDYSPSFSGGFIGFRCARWSFLLGDLALCTLVSRGVGGLLWRDRAG